MACERRRKPVLKSSRRLRKAAEGWGFSPAEQGPSNTVKKLCMGRRYGGTKAPPFLALGVSIALCSLSAGSLAPAPSASRWNILAEGGKGEMRGAPVCHRLAYFSGSPLRFDYEDDLSDLTPNKIRTTTEVKEIGVAAGRKVVQVVQSINDGDLVMKRLLVQRQGGEFCAIYQQQYAAAQVRVSPARIETISGQRILATKDPNGERTFNQEYWVFDSQGPNLLNLEVITQALKEVLPAGVEVRNFYGLEMNSLCYESPVWKDNECNACASGGTVALKLALQEHQLVVVRKSYNPAATYDPSADHTACVP